MWAMEAGILYYVAREFYYDRDKDLAKAHKKTRTTKKVTSKPGGETITEESTETNEPVSNGERGFDEPITAENTENRSVRREASPK